MGTRFRDRADHGGAFLSPQLAQLLFEPCMAFGGHGELLHGVPFLTNDGPIGSAGRAILAGPAPPVGQGL